MVLITLHSRKVEVSYIKILVECPCASDRCRRAHNEFAGIFTHSHVQIQ